MASRLHLLVDEAKPRTRSAERAKIDKSTHSPSRPLYPG